MFKGLIPAAGRGTRFGPFTQVIPKELLPVGNKAVIEHAVDLLKVAGITDISIVVSPGKHGISDYFGSGKRFDVNLTYVVQDERLGLANAIAAGEHVINGSSFVVVLGDTFLSSNKVLLELLKFHEDNNADATVGVVEVSDVTRYGIIEVDGINVVDLVEKPHLNEAPSKLGMTGVYIFKSIIFDAINNTLSGFDGEYQLTDAIKRLIDMGGLVIYKKLSCKHIDVGTSVDLMLANKIYANSDDENY